MTSLFAVLCLSCDVRSLLFFVHCLFYDVRSLLFDVFCCCLVCFFNDLCFEVLILEVSNHFYCKFR